MKYIEKSIKTKLSKVYIPLAILVLSAVYIWTALPALSNSLRFLITAIAIALALILAYFVQQESNQMTETPNASLDTNKSRT